MKTFAKGLKTRRTYEAPRAEIIEIESQGVLCASGGGGGGGSQTATGVGGNGGIHFGTNNGQW